MASVRCLEEPSDDEFPELNTTLRRNREKQRPQQSGQVASRHLPKADLRPKTSSPLKKEGNVGRRRKLRQISDNPLLRPFSQQDASASTTIFADDSDIATPRKTPSRALLRERIAKAPTLVDSEDEGSGDDDDADDIFDKTPPRRKPTSRKRAEKTQPRRKQKQDVEESLDLPREDDDMDLAESNRVAKTAPVTQDELLQASIADEATPEAESEGSEEKLIRDGENCASKQGSPSDHDEPGPRVQLRQRRPAARSAAAWSDDEDLSEEEETEDEDMDEESDFNTENEPSDDDDDDDDFSDSFSKRTPPRKRSAAKKKESTTISVVGRVSRNGSISKQARDTVVDLRKSPNKTHASSLNDISIRLDQEMEARFSRLRLDGAEDAVEVPKKAKRPTQPGTPQKGPPKILMSPSKKLSQIPKTPHRPSMDLFWDQDVTNEWNDKFSPKKLFTADEQPKSPSKKSPVKTSTERDAKKAFAAAKHEIAERFLRELDEAITNGQLAELAASTGGIKLNWTNKLNTTAGRANWRRETVRTAPTGGGGETATQHRHHASIELAEKVIDDEHRLLNVVAHEFCHLANFMVSGVTGNPHGREFKEWAARCSRRFAARGIEVTTKHSYDIDFKYAWECAGCGAEYKRHSRSINPDRHRCGACKMELRQTRPVPRAAGPKASEYQTFMREQMKVVREENPGSPQKEIMKLVAEKWSKLNPKAGNRSRVRSEDKGVDEVATSLEVSTIDAEV